MPTYVVLMNWTEQGIKAYKESPKRIEAAKKTLEPRGIKFRSVHYTMGPHDLVVVLEAPNDELLNKALLEIGSQGNVRSLTLKSWTPEEFTRMVSG